MVPKSTVLDCTVCCLNTVSFVIIVTGSNRLDIGYKVGSSQLNVALFRFSMW